MAPFALRVVEESDLAQLLALYRELGEGYAARMPADIELSRDVLIRIVEDQARHLWVATDGGKVVGAAELIVVPNLTHHARPWGVIENVIVSEVVRGRGAGTVLLDRLIEIARAEGCYKVQLHSGKQRVEAHRLYRKVGFNAVAEGFKMYFDETRSSWSSEPHV
jgi:ribosomal protein S18 acetylase RimI-like enzyme